MPHLWKVVDEITLQNILNAISKSLKRNRRELGSTNHWKILPLNSVGEKTLSKISFSNKNYTEYLHGDKC